MTSRPRQARPDTVLTLLARAGAQERVHAGGELDLQVWDACGWAGAVQNLRVSAELLTLYPAPCNLTLNPGPWTLNPGPWTLDPGP